MICQLNNQIKCQTILFIKVFNGPKQKHILYNYPVKQGIYNLGALGV